MKQEVVPTSPKSQHRQERDAQKDHAPGRMMFFVIVVSLLFGSTAGMLGFIIAANVPSEWPLIGKINVAEIFERERQNTLLAVRGEEESLIEQSPNVISEIVSVYETAPTIEQPSTFLGNAVITTSDGWLVATTDILPADATKAESLVVVLSDGTIAKITKRADDALTGLSFLHVDARNLDVANFSSNTTVKVGQTVSVVEKQMGSYVVYERRAAGEAVRSNTVRSTRRMDQLLLIDPADVAARSSSPVFANNGDLIGIMTQKGIMVPAAVVYGAVQSVIANGEVKRSIADIEYINAARLTDDQKTVRTLPEQGIYVTTVKTQEPAAGTDAVVKDATELKQGDSITAINGVNVTEFTDLSTVIHSKPKGTLWRLQVQRDGKTISVDWTS